MVLAPGTCTFELQPLLIPHCKKARVFVNISYFHPGLLFTARARTYTARAPNGTEQKG